MANRVAHDSRLYVGNLNYDTKVREIKDVFGKFGDLVAIQIKNGYGFIEYENPADAQCVREKMNLKKFNGRTIIIRKATPKLDSPSPSPKRSRSRSRSRIPSQCSNKMKNKKEDVDESDKITCFYCGKKGHWKIDCEKRKQFIEDKIACGELRQDYYELDKIGTNEVKYQKSPSRNSNRSRKRSRSRTRKHRGSTSSSSLSFSIPSDCSDCKRILKERKAKRTEKRKLNKEKSSRDNESSNIQSLSSRLDNPGSSQTERKRISKFATGPETKINEKSVKEDPIKNEMSVKINNDLSTKTAENNQEIVKFEENKKDQLDDINISLETKQN